MSLLYCAVSNQSDIVCSHAIAKRDFGDLIRDQIPKNVSDGHHLFSTNQADVHAFHVNGISFVAVTSKDTSRQQTLEFLTKFAEYFAMNAAVVEQAKIGSANCLQNSYGLTLKNFAKTFDQYRSHPQMAALQFNVQGVTNQLKQNVTELMKRGDLATDLASKTAEMESDARMFETYSKKVEQKERCKNIRCKFMLIGISLAVLFVIIMIILWQTGVFRGK